MAVDGETRITMSPRAYGGKILKEEVYQTAANAWSMSQEILAIDDDGQIEVLNGMTAAISATRPIGTYYPVAWANRVGREISKSPDGTFQEVDFSAKVPSACNKMRITFFLDCDSASRGPRVWVSNDSEAVASDDTEIFNLQGGASTEGRKRVMFTYDVPCSGGVFYCCADGDGVYNVDGIYFTLEGFYR